jgi:hypothetical protein
MHAHGGAFLTKLLADLGMLLRVDGNKVQEPPCTTGSRTRLEVLFTIRSDGTLDYQTFRHVVRHSDGTNKTSPKERVPLPSRSIVLMTRPGYGTDAVGPCHYNRCATIVPALSTMPPLSGAPTPWPVTSDLMAWPVA